MQVHESLASLPLDYARILWFEILNIMSACFTLHSDVGDFNGDKNVCPCCGGGVSKDSGKGNYPVKGEKGKEGRGMFMELGLSMVATFSTDN